MTLRIVASVIAERMMLIDEGMPIVMSSGVRPSAFQ